MKVLLPSLTYTYIPVLNMNKGMCFNHFVLSFSLNASVTSCRFYLFFAFSVMYAYRVYNVTWGTGPSYAACDLEVVLVLRCVFGASED